MVDKSAVVPETIERWGDRYHLVMVIPNDSFLYDFYRRFRAAEDVSLLISPLQKQHPNDKGKSAIYVRDWDLETLEAIQYALSEFLQSLPPSIRDVMIPFSSELPVRCSREHCKVILQLFVKIDDQKFTLAKNLGRAIEPGEVAFWAYSESDAIREYLQQQPTHDVVDFALRQRYPGKHYFAA